MQSWIFLLKRIRFTIEALLDWVFDGFSLRRCFACKRACADPKNGFFCPRCYLQLNLDFAKSRKEINFSESELGFLLGKEDFYYPKIYYSLEYSDLTKFLVREFKYRRPYYGSFPGTFLADFFSKNLNLIFADLSEAEMTKIVYQDYQDKPIKIWLAPVPMHRDKLLKRSYNQAEILAREFFYRFSLNFTNEDFSSLYQSSSGLALHSINHLEFVPDLLLRIKNTGSLFDKSRQERIEIMAESLVLNRELDLDLKRNHENILVIVDDIVTTGATFISCYRAILGSRIAFDDVIFLAFAGSKM